MILLNKVKQNNFECINLNLFLYFEIFEDKISLVIQKKKKFLKFYKSTFDISPNFSIKNNIYNDNYFITSELLN